MNINDWKVKRDSTVLGQVLTFIPGLDQTKVVSKALDGTTYIQTIGTANPYSEIEILCDASQMRLVNAAEADGAVISAEYRGVRYFGYIEEPPTWNAVMPGEWYKTSIKLLIQDEVAV